MFYITSVMYEHVGEMSKTLSYSEDRFVAKKIGFAIFAEVLCLSTLLQAFLEDPICCPFFSVLYLISFVPKSEFERLSMIKEEPACFQACCEWQWFFFFASTMTDQS